MLRIGRCAQGIARQSTVASTRSFTHGFRYRSPQSLNWSATAGAIGLAGGAVALNLSSKRVDCETSPESAQTAPSPATTSDEGVEEVPQSIVNYKHLGFGSGCGVFLKKGAKILAFFIGGAFVFLQYMRSQGLIVVKWDNISKRYNASLKRKFEGDEQKGVTVATVWNKLVEYVLSHLLIHANTANPASSQQISRVVQPSSPV
ncbi:hypothetical protein E3P99_00725 [Wallemia hederae]|uniref:FUN14 domain-containing protein n=1 Tax=Wallemia hederae TaxID=1540922 RepID=A0A4T0FU29_9BASI|nr:hypothetical protein E3P99_00725 [Wallemia hederae]